MDQSATVDKHGSGQSRLIDRIIYLASLASDMRAIEPMMDSLRAVTALRDPNAPLSSVDTVTLTQLEGDLKRYLTHQDPLRTFKPEVLERRLDDQFGERRLSLWVFIVAIGLAFGGAAVPRILGIDAGLALGSKLVLLILALEAGWFYLTAVTDFKPEIRRVFIWLSLGILLFAAGFSSYAAVQLFHIDNRPPFNYGGTTWLLTAAFLCIYVGLRRFAQALQLQAWHLQFRYLGVASLLVSVVIILAPHRLPVAAEGWYDFSLAGTVLCPLVAVFGVATARSIIRTVTTVYAKPVRWFLWYLAVGGLISLGTAAALVMEGGLRSASENLINMIIGVIPQLLLLYSGYAFKREVK